MGGENSEITNATKNILIESAHFNPSSVRKTAKNWDCRQMHRIVLNAGVIRILQFGLQEELHS
jgi:hypothetical protein